MGGEWWGWGAVALGVGLAVGMGGGRNGFLQVERVALQGPPRYVISGVLAQGGDEIVLADAGRGELRRYSRNGRFLGRYTLPNGQAARFVVRAAEGYRVETRTGNLIHLDSQFHAVHREPVEAPPSFRDLSPEVQEALRFVHGYVPGWGFLVNFDSSESNAWGMVCGDEASFAVPSQAEHLVAFGDEQELVLVEDHRMLLTIRLRPVGGASSLLRLLAAAGSPNRRSGRGKASGLATAGAAFLCPEEVEE